MINKSVTFETVRRIALALPGVDEATAFGKPAFKIKGKLLATLPSHRSVEPDTLVVRVDRDQRAELLAADPDAYYLTEHYEGFDGVLVRMPRIRHEALIGLLTMAHHYVSRPAGKIARKASGR